MDSFELEEEEEEEARDIVSDELPPSLSVPSMRARRVSVSAESIQPSSISQHEYIVHPKTDDQKKRITEAIANNFLFKNLDDDQAGHVVNAMAEKPVSKGTVVIEQGAEGDFYYIVESGTFDCFIQQGGSGEKKKVMSYVNGGSFGELALMYNAPRAATITATSDGVLWALDRITFRSILMDSSVRKRRMYERFLSEVPILRSLKTYERHKIADALEPIQFEDKQVIMREGDVGQNFYLIEDGEAVFYKTAEDGTQTEVNRSSKGDYFGELALLHDKPRAATVVADGRLKCVTLGKKAFTRLLGPVMDILKRNSENYHAILREATKDD
ncbi:cyclic nucleotide-binding-like protein [Circinella umbellata]|nr:cyclic nucleotide-binding-like protein [Circinella umbellata]